MNEVVPIITGNLRTKLMAKGYGEPLSVPFVIKPDCGFSQCWLNVQTMIQREGGGLVIGRIIWQQESGLWLHLEAHAIWRTPDGRLVDPTPKVESETEVVFVEDDFKYVGEVMIPSKYIVMSKSPKVRRFVEVLEQRAAIINAILSGSRPNDVGTLEENKLRLAGELMQLAQELFPQDYVRMMRQAQSNTSVLMGHDTP